MTDRTRRRQRACADLQPPLLLLVLPALLSCRRVPGACGFVAVAVEGWGRGRVIRSVDGGVSWTAVVEAYIDLHGVALPSPFAVVAVGKNGTIITSRPNVTLPAAIAAVVSTAPATSALSPLYTSSYPGSYLQLVHQYAARAANSSAFASYYQALDPPPAATAWTLSATPFVYAELSPPSTSDLRGVVFLTPFLGVAVGASGAVYRTVGGGLYWTQVALSFTIDLNAVTVAAVYASSSSSSAPTGWLLMACGNVGSVLLSTDGGLSWSASATGTSSNLYGIAMLDDNTALACGAGGSLLSTADGGSRWSRLPQPDYSAASFYAVAFYSRSIVFISGSDGRLLRSDDGGWTLTQLQLSPASPHVNPLSSLVLTPSTLLTAGRSHLYSAASPSAAWSSGPSININSVAAMAALEAGVLTVAVPSFNLSTFCGADLQFNVSVRNSGTDTLTITAVASADRLIVLLPPAPELLPVVLLPSSAPLLLNFSYSSSLLPWTTATYYTNLTLLCDAPVQVVAVSLSVYTLPPPSSSSTSFLSQYWYVIALIGAAVCTLLFVFVRRRIRYVQRWNRRVLYDDQRLSFWGCWLLSRDIEHESDSDFWSEEDDDNHDAHNANADSSGQDEELEGERKEEAAAGGSGPRHKAGRVLRAAGGSEAEDDGGGSERWLDADDDGDSDSSISSQEFHDDDHMQVRRAVKVGLQLRRASRVLTRSSFSRDAVHSSRRSSISKAKAW